MKNGHNWRPPIGHGHPCQSGHGCRPNVMCDYYVGIGLGNGAADCNDRFSDPCRAAPRHRNTMDIGEAQSENLVLTRSPGARYRRFPAEVTATADKFENEQFSPARAHLADYVHDSHDAPSRYPTVARRCAVTAKRAWHI